MADGGGSMRAAWRRKAGVFWGEIERRVGRFIWAGLREEHGGKSQRNRRGFPLGFVRGVRVHHGDVEVMSGGACLSAREKGELGLGRCLLHARGLARWLGPVS